MSRRFFVEAPIQDDSTTILGQEARHLNKVMRAKVGDDFILFDGSGAEFLAQISSSTKSEVSFTIVERREIDRELPMRLVIGVALPKGDRQRWLVEKLVELGVTSLVPLITTNSVALPSKNGRERLQRAVIEASKQCGRNRLMEIAEGCSFEKFVLKSPEIRNRLIAHPTTDCNPVPSLNAEDSIVAIGPEGGLTDDEVSLAIDNGWGAVSLGSRILRTETAAIAITSRIALR